MKDYLKQRFLDALRYKNGRDFYESLENEAKLHVKTFPPCILEGMVMVRPGDVDVVEEMLNSPRYRGLESIKVLSEEDEQGYYEGFSNEESLCKELIRGGAPDHWQDTVEDVLNHTSMELYNSCNLEHSPDCWDELNDEHLGVMITSPVKQFLLGNELKPCCFGGRVIDQELSYSFAAPIHSRERNPRLYLLKREGFEKKVFNKGFLGLLFQLTHQYLNSAETQIVVAQASGSGSDESWKRVYS